MSEYHDQYRDEESERYEMYLGDLAAFQHDTWNHWEANGNRDCGEPDCGYCKFVADEMEKEALKVKAYAFQA